VSKKAATETDAERQTEVTNPLNFIVEPPGNYGRQLRHQQGQILLADISGSNDRNVLYDRH